MKRVIFIVLLLCGSVWADGWFGYTTTGGTASAMLDNNCYGHGPEEYLASAAANAYIDSVGIFMYSSDGTGTMCVGVYDAADTSLVDSSAAITATLTSGGQWEYAETNIPLSEGADYFLMMGNETGEVTVFRDYNAADGSRNASSGTLVAEPSLITLDYKISIKAHWTTSGGGGGKFGLRR